MKKVLGIETSCDETGAAVLRQGKNGIQILSNVLASSAKLQAKYGGIIPEQAAREQIKSIIPVIEEALKQAKLKSEDLDAIAVTLGPGLIGSLLVGVETAKTLAKVWNKPLIPVNHLIGHFYANWIDNTPQFPCIGLLVSGGHTDLVLMQEHGKYQYLGGTRDDAAGECFDKCARLLGLPYPGGPHLSKLAQKGNPTHFKLPIPMKGSGDFDFSYSGLKTAVANLLYAKNLKIKSRDPSLVVQDDNMLPDLAASIEDVIVKSLIEKVIKAAHKYQVNQIMVAGGVAANQKLNNDLRAKINDLGLDIQLHIPQAQLCTDNAAMIAAAAFFQKPLKNPLNLQADPSRSL